MGGTSSFEAPSPRPTPRGRGGKAKLTIVVGGYIIGYPLGGMTWHHLNYLLGLHELGHEVWFLEDSGEFSLPYNPQTQTCDPDSTFGRAYLEQTFGQYGLPQKYCYYSQFEDRHYGLSRDELHDLLRRADLLICVSGVTPLRESRPRPRRTLAIDTDPVYTQVRMSHDERFAGYWRSFDRVATFGRLIGTAKSPLPTHGLNWIGTNQPVALAHWPVVPRLGEQFTTIGKWEHTTSRAVEFAGRSFASSKSVEWMKVIDLPKLTNAQLALAMESMPGDVKCQFESHGWHCIDAEAATRTCQSYQEFISKSAGEFTVVKQIYSGIPSGWFSDRSACYLATGRPVVTQASGFEQWLPAGEGLFAFENVEQAAQALETIRSDPTRHMQAARLIAEEHFDSRRVLGELLSAVL
jgi:hypothetical protein